VSERAPADALVEVTVNGAPQRLRPGTSVAELVLALGRSPQGIAVSVNEEVVSRGRWAATPLHAGDRIEVLAAAQGG
jgi:sulfur carrier protein